MKIYTKTGDAGETGLFGGTRLPKSHYRIQAYGDVDELNSWVGYIRDGLASILPTPLLTDIQDRLFTMGSHLAADPGKNNLSLPPFEASNEQDLESAIDAMEAELPPMKHFILPGGHVLVAQIHIARTVCRRAERSIVALHGMEPVSVEILKYINRLSDYLFVLSRFAAKHLEAKEIPWIPKKQ